ncbi:MAG: glucose-6-phosphate dehydrogenase [Anaerolineaceae bacterium]|nr:glucose-6-phosphate dehydrogenase [Anaerolineaceae bacterium]
MNIEPQDPATIIIFGASGDLTRRKLIPALYNLHCKKRIPEETKIIGFARRPYYNDTFRAKQKEGLLQFSKDSFDEQTWSEFAPKIEYFQGDLNNVEDYQKLEDYLQNSRAYPANRIYYLATSPDFYTSSVTYLGANGMTIQEKGDRKIVIEKPFGKDLSSAESLNRILHAAFDESQIFRIDHFLGKETAQNIMIFRFANSIFEPIWNRRYVSNVQITVAEAVDAGHRAGYYDEAGVLRDMFQNHLLQLMTLIALEPPSSFEANALRNEKVKVLKAVRPINNADTVLAQYKGYLDEQGVKPDSRTPTYAAINLFIDNWRWKGVPFYLRSGKALAKKSSEIVIEFQSPPHLMFALPTEYKIASNTLSICIQPDEGIHLKFEAKLPDSTLETRSVIMDFHYLSSFGEHAIPDAYERLLVDTFNGDASLFARSDEIEQAWKIIDPVIQGWENRNAPPLGMYKRGSSGPIEAINLLGRNKHTWHRGCGEHMKSYAKHTHTPEC